MNQRYLALSFVCALTACGSTGPAPSAATDAQMVERTIVKLLPDGSEDVKTEQVTVAQQRREWAAREQRLHAPESAAGGVGVAHEGLASLDSGCVGSSMWIFDSNDNSVGTPPMNHEICFYKSSAAFPVCTDLRQYARMCFAPGGGCQNWATDNGNWIGSFYSGVDQGMFLDVNGAVQEGFGAYYMQNDAQGQVGRATYLCFPNN